MPPLTSSPAMAQANTPQALDITSIVSSIVSALVPIIMETVQETIERAMGEAARADHNEIGRLRHELVRQAWKNDANEQYSRRENIRIIGVEKPAPQKDQPPPSTNQIVINTCQKMGVVISDQDISTSHWLPGRKPTIIAKFVRRDTKADIMRNKKHLKKNDPSITEDLTKARVMLLEEIKKDPRIKRAFAMDGIIRCAFDEHNDGEERRVSIRGPGDLLQIGWSGDDIDWTYSLFP